MVINRLILPIICLSRCVSESVETPNIIVILADDLGFGDVSAYGTATIRTPHIDRLANEGACFTNAYATSATSAPSRYALMTGMYPWKNKDAKILVGGAPLIIDEHQFTLPKMMKSVGYATGVVGKWHLGMGNGNVDWNEVVKLGAKEIGFDYSCLIAAVNDRMPTVCVEGGKVVGLDSDDLINKVKDFVSDHKGKPFFLYYGLHQSHVPRAPHGRAGTTMRPCGDAIVEADWCVGELIAHLEKEDLQEKTMIIFTSDNGPVQNGGYKGGVAEKAGEHKPAGGIRGGKYSPFDDGTHIPLFVYWKGTISPVTSDALICQMDLVASLGKLVNASLPEGLDSREYLDVFMGKKLQARENLIVEAQGRMAYRQGDWMMIPPFRGQERNLTGNELGNLNEYALFNLKDDKAQQENRAAENKPLLEEMKESFFTLTDGYYKSEAEEEPLK